LARRNEWQGMRDNGRAFVEQERTWQSSVARYKTVYARVL
jgi:hypothetical protein